MLNNNGPLKWTPGELRNVNVPLTISYHHQFVLKFIKKIIVIFLNFFFQDDQEEDPVEVGCFIFSTDKYKK